MPIAIKEAGFITGVFCLIFIGIVVDQSVIMLVECGIRMNKKDFEELSFHLFGQRGFNAASLFMFLYAYVQSPASPGYFL
jgi:amino acid permease